MIRLSGVPCVNTAEILLRNFDRLGMLASLRAAGLPAPEFDAVSDTEVLERVAVSYPRVLKIGGLHGGFGKAKADDPESWAEARDLAYAAGTYATVEPYLEHERDVRCLLIGDAVFAMERRGRGWRANVDTIEHRLIDPPPDLEAMTRRLGRHLGATLIAVDALETANGWVVIESNETPGLSGFPELARLELARLLLAAMAAGVPAGPG
jgi:ribosomal protein S6--L-glutamate ligase